MQPGVIVGGYRIERRLGAGGMGAVYLAKHPELPKYDALKVLNAQFDTDDEFRKRFLREAEMAARLDHPNIVAVYNRGSDQDRLWIAMQYVEGSDCAQLLARTPTGLNPVGAAHIVSEVSAGLDHAHRRGLTHRDIKPANILLAKSEDGGYGRVLLTDFGVAKLSDDAHTLTQAGSVLATLAYASPEQLRGDDVDRASDQYSLAASYFHLVTGKVPFGGAAADAVIQAHLFAPPPRLSQIRHGVSPAVDIVLAKALSKSAADRFENCSAFAKALEDAVRRAPATVHPLTSHNSGPYAMAQRPQRPPQAGPHQAGPPQAGPPQAGVPQPVQPQPRYPGPSRPSTGVPRQPQPYHPARPQGYPQRPQPNPAQQHPQRPPQYIPPQNVPPQNVPPQNVPPQNPYPQNPQPGRRFQAPPPGR